MNRQYARKHTARRVLAVLLSLLMMLQSVSAFAEDIDVPETNPEETVETIVQVPEIHEDSAPCDPDLAELKEAISEMPEKLRTALVLVYQEGYSYQEAAEALGIHPVALKSRLKRAKAMLKSQLIELEED